MSFAIHVSRTSLNRGPTVFPLQSTQHPMRNLPESVISVNAHQPNEQVRDLLWREHRLLGGGGGARK